MDEMLATILEGTGWELDGIGDGAVLIAPDGCYVEPDGRCPHGHVSPLLTMGLI